jgi:hypothetical protein
MKFQRYASGVVSMLALIALIGINADSAAAQMLQWQTILGVTQTGDQVGVGTGAVFGGAPWETLGGLAIVNVKTSGVTFNVRGLILSVGSVAALGATGVPIGTPGGVTEVKGTLVCDVDGTANSGNSIDIDTPATALDAQGNAQFSGKFVSHLPALCSSGKDDAFVIRIVEPAAFAGAWIAFGAVLSESY